MSDSVVGPWAREKLACLGKYVSAYTEIMKMQEWCLGYHYVDAFAGPGSHRIRGRSSDLLAGLFAEVADYQRSSSEETSALINGSPRVALEIEHPFSSYTFIEKSTERAEHLNALKDEFPQSDIRVVPKACADFLQNDFLLSHTWTKERAFVFLDPFGMQVTWATIEELARTEAIEVLVNFPVGMAIQRLLRRKPDEIPVGQRQKLDDYFGTPDWLGAVYQKRKTLFDLDVSDKVEDSGKALLKWYHGRLKTAFGHASDACLIRNTIGGHLYYLVLATPKKVAAKIMSNVFQMGERIKL